MLGIYRTTGDRFDWWLQGLTNLVEAITLIFVSLVSILSFGQCFTTWDIEWAQKIYLRLTRPRC